MSVSFIGLAVIVVAAVLAALFLFGRSKD